MEISYLGGGVVRLSGTHLNVACGPAPVKLSGGIMALTLAAPDEKATDGVMTLDGPGEYEVGGTLVTAVATGDGELAAPTSYVFSVEELTVAYVAGSNRTLTNPELEAIGRVDVLVLPIGSEPGGFAATTAAGVVSQIEPSYIIPVEAAAGTKSDWSAAFTKEVGATPQKTAKLKLTHSNLPEEPAVVLLEAAKS